MITPIPAIAPLDALTVTAPGASGAANAGESFAAALGRGLDAVGAAQAGADGLAVQAATGQLADPAQYTIAATEAQLMTQLATTIESKAVTSFNTVMGMQA